MRYDERILVPLEDGIDIGSGLEVGARDEAVLVGVDLLEDRLEILLCVCLTHSNISLI